jgi:hypothetical protein
MALSPNPVDLTTAYATFLTGAVSGGTWADVLDTEKVDTQASTVPQQAFKPGQWWGNLVDSYIAEAWDHLGVAEPFQAGLAAVCEPGTADGAMQAWSAASGRWVEVSELSWSGGAPRLPTYTVATLPSASPVNRMAFVSDHPDGPSVVYSDGTDWIGSHDRRPVDPFRRAMIDEHTRFLGYSATPNDWNELAIDRSKLGEDLNPLANNASNLTHTATNGLISTRCVECIVYVDSVATQYLVVKSNLSGGITTNARWVITYTGSFQARHGDGATWAQILTTTSVATPIQRTYYVAWSEEPNPSTTGPSDAKLSTLHVWDLDNSMAYTSWPATHAEFAHDPTGFAVGAREFSGNSVQGAGGETRFCRVSSKARDRAEIEAYMPAVLAEVGL